MPDTIHNAAELSQHKWNNLEKVMEERLNCTENWIIWTHVSTKTNWIKYQAFLLIKPFRQFLNSCDVLLAPQSDPIKSIYSFWALKPVYTEAFKPVGGSL